MAGLWNWPQISIWCQIKNMWSCITAAIPLYGLCLIKHSGNATFSTKARFWKVFQMDQSKTSHVAAFKVVYMWCCRCTPPPSPSSRCHTPLHHSHHRSLSETVKQSNANGGDAGRVSAFQRLESNPRLENSAQTSHPLQQQDLWKSVQSGSTDAEWDTNKVVG